eukprot:12086634-Prorocentrum_lima.AAC.1
MDLTRDKSPALSERASRLQRITKGDLVTPQKQQPQSRSVVPAPTVERQQPLIPLLAQASGHQRQARSP